MSERMRVAVHEAGHAIVAAALNRPFLLIDLFLEDGRWGGSTTWPDDDTLIDVNVLRAVSVAGIVAESLTYGWTLGRDDVIGMVMDLHELGEYIRSVDPPDRWSASIRHAFTTAEAILTERRAALDAIAAALESKERLTYAEVSALAEEMSGGAAAGRG